MKIPHAGPAAQTIDAPRHKALGSASRLAILRLVRAAASGLTADEIAAGTGLHPSTVRAHLDRLTETGLLIRARASGGLPGRPAWRYRATAGDPAPAPYRGLAAALLDNLAGTGRDTRAEAVRVGRRWGQRLAAGHSTADPVDTVIGVLDGLGFTPRPQPAQPDDGGTEVHLHTCPFLELVASHPDAMCALHLGVIRGVLEQKGAAGAGTVLDPFGAPTACVVRLPARAEPAGAAP